MPPAPASDLYAREAELHALGYARVAGIDEAGRGPLAGPVVVAAVVLPPAYHLPGLNDSKQLSARQRERLAAALLAEPDLAHAIIVVDAGEIDQLNIYQATCVGMRRAAAALRPPPQFLLVDGLPVRDLPFPSEALVKGDARCAAIAAASVLAKVHRDHLMAQYDAQYPVYGFARHQGYPTAAHLAALLAHGPCPIHRRSYAPVAAALAARGPAAQPELL